MPADPRAARSLSPADRLALLPEAERAAWLSTLSAAEAAELEFNWDAWWSRPEQRLPAGNWINWLVLAGRGFGKTRCGAEAVRKWIKSGFRYVNLIGATFEDVEDTMVLGESGILAICPKDERPRWVKNELRWPNGARSLVFTAEEPDRLRGKQHDKLWMDELAAWRYPAAYDQAAFGLRLGSNPQAIITTTPRPTKIIKDLVKAKTTVVTRGSTYDNAANLADAFISTIVGKYEGTNLGKQELYAQIIDDVPNALWTRAVLERATTRVVIPRYRRGVVALDPSVSNTENSDEFGMVAAAVGEDGHGYVLEDASANMSIRDWPQKAIKLYRHMRDVLHIPNVQIVAEVNNGGDMIEHSLRVVDPTIKFAAVHAMKGKAARAEPVALLYEKGLIHHTATFPKLEDQMAMFTSDFDRKAAGYSPDRVDALVWALNELKIEPAQGSTGMLDFYRNAAQRARPAAIT